MELDTIGCSTLNAIDDFFSSSRTVSEMLQYIEAMHTFMSKGRPFASSLRRASHNSIVKAVEEVTEIDQQEASTSYLVELGQVRMSIHVSNADDDIIQSPLPAQLEQSHVTPHTTDSDVRSPRAVDPLPADTLAQDVGPLTQ